MTTSESNLPLFRVSFARNTGQDGQGNDTLGRFREIGAIWPRRNGKAGGILSFDIVPAELSSHQGVLLVLPVEEDAASPTQD